MTAKLINIAGYLSNEDYSGAWLLFMHSKALRLVDQVDDTHKTPLHSCAREGLLEFAKTLLFKH